MGNKLFCGYCEKIFNETSIKLCTNCRKKKAEYNKTCYDCYLFIDVYEYKSINLINDLNVKKIIQQQIG